MTLHEALRALNSAAYAAIRAGRDTSINPDLDRQTLREICAMTDRLVDDNAPDFEPLDAADEAFARNEARNRRARIDAVCNPEPEPLDAETIAARRAMYESDLIAAGRGHLVGE